EQHEDIFSSEVATATLRLVDRPEIDRLLDYLDTKIEANGAKKPSRSKRNRDAVRLMLDRDGRTAEQVRAAIDYATGDEFWRANILCASKLREKYDQLSLSAQRAKWKRPVGRHEREQEFWEQQMAQARA